MRSYVDWMADLKLGTPRIRTILLMEAFFKALRADLGISNFGLKDGDFAHLMLRHGNLFVSMAKKNPYMTLAELAELEKVGAITPAAGLEKPPLHQEKSVTTIS